MFARCSPRPRRFRTGLPRGPWDCCSRVLREQKVHPQKLFCKLQITREQSYSCASLQHGLRAGSLAQFCPCSRPLPVSTQTNPSDRALGGWMGLLRAGAQRSLSPGAQSRRVCVGAPGELGLL